MKTNKELLPISVKDSTKDGKCSNCGHCCSTFLPLSQGEIDRIKGYLRNHPKITEEQHVDWEKGSMYMTCAFRDSKKKTCKIYEVRPEICRKFICNQPKGIIRHNRDKAMANAVYNTMKKPQASTQYIFFDDIAWEIQFLRNTSPDLNKAILMARSIQSPVLQTLLDLKKGTIKTLPGLR